MKKTVRIPYPLSLLLVLLMIGGVGTLLIHWLLKSEQPSRYLPNYQTSLHEGRWVPDQFPHDIIEIYEQHDLDTRDVWLAFQHGQQGMAIQGYRKVGREDVRVTRPYDANWWFKTLPENYSFYRGECDVSANNQAVSGESTLAMSGDSPVVYWWCQPNGRVSLQ